MVEFGHSMLTEPEGQLICLGSGIGSGIFGLVGAIGSVNSLGSVALDYYENGENANHDSAMVADWGLF